MPSLLLEMFDHTAKRVDIPEGATFTFGSVVPGKYTGHDGWAIRIKVGSDQVAVITGVRNAWLAEHVSVFQNLGANGEELGESDPFLNVTHQKLTPDMWDAEVPL